MAQEKRLWNANAVLAVALFTANGARFAGAAHLLSAFAAVLVETAEFPATTAAVAAAILITRAPVSRTRIAANRSERHALIAAAFESERTAGAPAALL